MTRVDFGLNHKPNENEEKPPLEQQQEPDQQAPVDCVIADIDLIDQSNQAADGEEKIETPKVENETSTKTMDWMFVRRVALGQIILATLSMICLLVTVVIGGVTWFKFATFFWSTFILLAGYAGYKSYSTKNYYYVLTYLIMAAFQSLTNWFALVYSTYAVYYFENRELHYYKGYCLGISYRDVALFLELTESLTMMGTVITGILGAKACCSGLGRLLTYQDQLIQQRLAWRQ